MPDPTSAEAAVAGRKRIYLKHFYDRLAENPECFSNADMDFYIAQYSIPGSLRCSFLGFKMLEVDKVHNPGVAEKG